MGARSGSEADALFFSLERTPCFGKCRAYTITINGDGHAQYIGRSNVEMQGNWKAEVDHVTMEKLLDRAKASGFFDMQNTYDGQVTDLPSTIIRINADGLDKKVVARYKIPPAFNPFAAFCDSLLAPVKWTPVNDRQ